MRYTKGEQRVAILEPYARGCRAGSGPARSPACPRTGRRAGHRVPGQGPGGGRRSGEGRIALEFGPGPA
eukprot:scaffold104819_cov51-Phaeocystis_antarctica.AAC.2